MSMSNPTNHIEIITSVQRRRGRWTASEKVRMVEETFAPGRMGELGGSPTRRGRRTSSLRGADGAG